MSRRPAPLLWDCFEHITADQRTTARGSLHGQRVETVFSRGRLIDPRGIELIGVGLVVEKELLLAAGYILEGSNGCCSSRFHHLICIGRISECRDNRDDRHH